MSWPPFLAPGALALLALALPILVLYLLRLRRRRIVVSSTLLWQRFLRDREANTLWQRLRANLLLILQLLILLALVISLARPFWRTSTPVPGNAVLLLDASASMSATDVEPSRFAAAVREGHRLIDNLQEGDQMTLILAGRQPQILAAASQDRTILHRALSEAQPQNGAADWPAAIALASGAAQGFVEPQTIILSDGRLPAGLPDLPGEVSFRSFGRSASNVAITALALRDTGQAQQLLATVSNSGSDHQMVLLSLFDGDQLFDARRVEVPAGRQTSLTLAVPEAGRVISARLATSGENWLSIDDQAWTVAEGLAPARTLLLSNGNLFLQQILRVLSGIELFYGPAGAPPQSDGFDLTVVDGLALPEPLPAGDILIVNPQPGDPSPLFEVGEPFSETDAVVVANSPLVQNVNWRDVHISRAIEVSAPWAEPLVVSPGGPLLLAGEYDGRRVVVLTFDLHDSDLPLQIAFPVLIANITDWLRPGDTVARRQFMPGEVVTISPAIATNQLAVQTPNGELRPLAYQGDPIQFGQTHAVGPYEVVAENEEGEIKREPFVVNPFYSEEFDISPATSLTIGQSVFEDQGDLQTGISELWPWFAAAGLMLVLFEWWVHHRGFRLPWPRKVEDSWASG